MRSKVSHFAEDSSSGVKMIVTDLRNCLSRKHVEENNCSDTKEIANEILVMNVLYSL